MRGGSATASSTAAAVGERATVMCTMVWAMRSGWRSARSPSVRARRTVANTIVRCRRSRRRGDGFPPSDHREAVDIGGHGLAHLTIHATLAGLELIADALDCGAERVGHGVRLIEDVTIDGGMPAEGLVDIDLDRVHLGPLATYVRDRQIPLELAPTCNVQIGAVPSIATIRSPCSTAWASRATINTDNRLMSGVRVSTEVHEDASVNGFRWTEVEAVQVTGIQSAFCSLDERRRIEHEVIRPAYRSSLVSSSRSVTMGLTEKQRDQFERDGVLVIEGFADIAACKELIERSREMLEDFQPETVSIFTTHEQTRTSDEYFLDSGDKIRFFFEEDAFRPDGSLRQDKELSINKIGHALHDLDPVFDAFSRTPELAALAAELGLEDSRCCCSRCTSSSSRTSAARSTCHQDRRSSTPSR